MKKNGAPISAIIIGVAKAPVRQPKCLTTLLP
eukprot:CAMPEP_0205940022 /NCGR_PEP_ID=MMETSP1325-20131115/51265_1 /ASSEMBLY_ACC=CAM_ASM_000708 /TAXON_ID=236786 /ORGANISM="Florenciella sp., Strain RCC1007" /LENGTH=31 /DNA_ID= /DNA_START= /DNA_END= /DNA_ORIENTATION=